MTLGASLSPATPLPLAEERRSPAAVTAASTTTPSYYWIFINLSSPLAGSRRRRRLPSRTCVERGGAVRSALVIGDLDHVEYDYIITVLLNASARDLQRYVDASNHSLLDELLDDLGETSRKIFVFCNVPQQWHHELGLCVVLLAPAVQTSAGETACSCLQWPAVLPMRPLLGNVAENKKFPTVSPRSIYEFI